MIIGLFRAAAVSLAIAAVAPVAHGQVAVGSDSAPSFTDILAKAKKAGTTRVIVEFAAPTAARGDQAYADAVHAVQRAIIADVFGQSAARLASERSLRLMDYSPMFAVNVTPEELERLSRDSRVVRIHADELSKPELLQSLKLIKMEGANGAYASGATGQGRTVAILDTGVNKNHEFLKGKVVSEACYNTTDATEGSTSRCPGGDSSTAKGSGLDCGPTISGCGHGTHVAGIAAGKNTSQSPGEPKNGVAKSAKIIAIDVFSRFSVASGNCGGGATQDCLLSYNSDQISALERVFALRTKFTIDSINMSIGGGGFAGFCNSDSRKPIIDQLRSAGIATVIASGNDSFVNGVGAPGCIETAITVGASTKKSTGKPERMAFYTNEGPQVDTLAPGGDSSYPNGVQKEEILSSHFNTYEFLQGTSMATPHVTGAIAAIRSVPGCSGKTVTQIENALHTTGLKITDHRIVPGFPQLTSRRMDVVAVLKKLGCI
jgi:subtilisin family serine protease